MRRKKPKPDPPTHGWRAIGSLADMLEFVAGKVPSDASRDTLPPVDRDYHRDWNHTGLEEQDSVIFTDGTALAVVMEHGFRGSEVTGGDPAYVEWYAYDRIDSRSDA